MPMSITSMWPEPPDNISFCRGLELMVVTLLTLMCRRGQAESHFLQIGQLGPFCMHQLAWFLLWTNPPSHSLNLVVATHWLGPTFKCWPLYFIHHYHEEVGFCLISYRSTWSFHTFTNLHAHSIVYRKPLFCCIHYSSSLPMQVSIALV